MLAWESLTAEDLLGTNRNSCGLNCHRFIVLLLNFIAFIRRSVVGYSTVLQTGAVLILGPFSVDTIRTMTTCISMIFSFSDSGTLRKTSRRGPLAF
jgi:hypothetical protein